MKYSDKVAYKKILLFNNIENNGKGEQSDIEELPVLCCQDPDALKLGQDGRVPSTTEHPVERSRDELHHEGREPVDRVAHRFYQKRSRGFHS